MRVLRKSWLTALVLLLLPFCTSPASATPRLRGTPQTAPMVLVRAGCFMMGSPDTVIQEMIAEARRIDPNLKPAFFYNQQPIHSVCITRDFMIGQYEVTNAEYQEFIDSGGYQAQAYWSDDGWQWRVSKNISKPISYRGLDGPQQPRIGISWYEADAYARWRGARLLTEAEWEYAARGPTSSPFPWGNAFDGNRLNYCDKSCQLKWRDLNYDDGTMMSAPVGNMPGDRSWCDAYDLAGNVGEWVADWYASDYYISSPDTDPQGPEGGLSRIYRGASWDAIGVFAYSSIRFGVGAQTRLDHIGMRLAQSVSAERGQ